jgi:hypothetical protein
LKKSARCCKENINAALDLLDELDAPIAEVSTAAATLVPMPTVDKFATFEEYKKAMDAYDDDMRNSAPTRAADGQQGTAAATAGASSENAELIDLLKAIRPSYGVVGSRDVDVAVQQKRIDRAVELLSRTPAAGQQGASRAVLDDAQIIAALNARGIDTYPSKYGLNAVQVSGTTVPALREVFQDLARAPLPSQDDAREVHPARAQQTYEYVTQLVKHKMGAVDRAQSDTTGESK